MICEQAKLLRSSGFIDEIDDIITLEALNQTRQWKFPDTTQCPFNLCRREFGYRADAINHFIHKHAKNAYYCSKCETPIEVYRQDDIDEHNHRLHRNEYDPLTFDVSPSGSKSSSSSSAENVCYSHMAFT